MIGSMEIVLGVRLQLIIFFLLLFSGCTFSLPVFCSTKVIRETGHFRQIATRDGLSHQNITSVFQDNRDYIWVSTSDGLNLLNGKNSKNFFHDSGKKTSLSANNCWMMSETPKGDVLIASEGGLDAYRFSDNSFRKFLPGNIPVHQVVKDRHNHIWVSTFDQLFEMSASGNIIRDWTKQLSGKGDIQLIIEDFSGHIRVLKNYQLNILTPGTGTVENNLHNPRKLNYLDLRIRSYDFDKQTGIQWFLTENGELLKFNRQNEILISIHTKPEWYFTRLFISVHGQLWIGTLGKGLFCFRESENSFIQYSHQEGLSESICGNVINSIMEDRHRNLWIGTNQGLCVLPESLPAVRTFRNWGTEKYLPEMPVEITALHLEENELWAGSWGNGLYQLNTINSKKERINCGKSDIENMIWDVLPDHTGLWFGSYGGLYRYSFSGNRVISCRSWPSYPVKKDSVAAIRLFKDRKNQIWVSFLGNYGLMCFNPATKDFAYFNQNTSPSFGFPHFDAITESKDGRIFFGHQNRRGLLFFDPGLHQFKTLPGFGDYSNCLLADGGCLWVGSKNGLYLITNKGHVIRHYTRNDGLPNNQVNAIVKDGKGRLWAGTDNGIFYVDRNRGIRALNEPDLASGKEIHKAYFDFKSGQIWFVSQHFVFAFNPDSLQIPETNLRPEVTRILAGGVFLETGNQSTPEIGSETKSISFEFDAPCFFQPGVVRFSHKLVGLETGWSAESPGLTASYSNLSHGKYTFCVKGTIDGIKWFVAPNVSFEIALPVYRQTWFIVTLICSIIILLSLSVILYYQVQLARIRYGQNIRNKISEDIHDDISLGLTRIVWQTEMLLGKKETGPEAFKMTLHNILSTARETASKLSEIVWAINPTHENLASFLAYLRHYSGSLLSELDLSFEIDFPESIPDQKMDAMLVRNLFLIAKESLNNAIRHSGSTKITISFILPEGGKFQMKISDDGKGFRMGETSDFGNGLTNIKNRSEKIRAKFSLQSEPGKGCSVLISGYFLAVK